MIAVECRWQYFPLTKTCYGVCKTRKSTWQQTEDICEAYGGHLASIQSMEENVLIATISEEGFEVFKESHSIYIGKKVIEILVFVIHLYF